MRVMTLVKKDGAKGSVTATADAIDRVSITLALGTVAQLVVRTNIIKSTGTAMVKCMWSEGKLHDLDLHLAL